VSLLARVAAGFRALTYGDTGYKTPDVTRVQVLAIGQAVIAVLVVFGFDVDDDTRDLILFLAASLGAALPIADAVVRQGRAKSIGAIEQAQEKAAAAEAHPQLTHDERRRVLAGRDRLESGR
jgi:hypothetical protein